MARLNPVVHTTPNRSLNHGNADGTFEKADIAALSIASLAAMSDDELVRIINIARLPVCIQSKQGTDIHRSTLLQLSQLAIHQCQRDHH